MYLQRFVCSIFVNYLTLVLACDILNNHRGGYMGDVFKEQLVKKAVTGKNTALRFGIVALAVVVFFFSLTIPLVQQFSIFVAAVLAFVVYILITRQNIEYEYVFTNGELDIDIIYNKSKRKRLFSSSVKEFEIMAHVQDTAHTRDLSNAMETKDYSSGIVGPNTYAFITAYKGKRIKIIIEPNEMMIKAFSTVLTPRKLFKKL